MGREVLDLSCGVLAHYLCTFSSRNNSWKSAGISFGRNSDAGTFLQPLVFSLVWILRDLEKSYWKRTHDGIFHDAHVGTAGEFLFYR